MDDPCEAGGHAVGRQPEDGELLAVKVFAELAVLGRRCSATLVYSRKARTTTVCRSTGLLLAGWSPVGSTVKSFSCASMASKCRTCGITAEVVVERCHHKRPAVSFRAVPSQSKQEPFATPWSACWGLNFQLAMTHVKLNSSIPRKPSAEGELGNRTLRVRSEGTPS